MQLGLPTRKKGTVQEFQTRSKPLKKYFEPIREIIIYLHCTLPAPYWGRQGLQTLGDENSGIRHALDEGS